MSVNLLDLAKSALGSGAMGQLAGSLGESEEKTKSAFDVAGSAILGSLIQKASSPKGAEEVFGQAKEFDTGLLDGLGDLLTGGSKSQSSSDWTSLGGKLVSGLFGNKETSTIEMLAKVAGIGQGSSKSLLSMLAPLLLGLVAKKVKSGDLGLSDLVDLIMGQKSQVAKNLPADFSQQLGIAGLLDEGADQVRAAGAQVTRATRETADSGASLLKTLVPLAILLGLGYFGWKMLPAAKEVAEKTTEIASTAAEATSDAAVDVVDAAKDRIELNKPAIPKIDLDAITSKLGNSFTDVTKSVAGVTDEASARVVVPQIDQLQKLYNGYGLGTMPEEATESIGGVLRPLIEKLQAAIEMAYKIPGVKAILEPATKGLMESVSAFAGAK